MKRQLLRVICALALGAAIDHTNSSSAASPMNDVLLQDFRGAERNMTNWTVLPPEEFTRAEADGVVIDMPEDAGAVPSAGLGARFSLRGDFELSAAFELIEVPTPKEGFGAGATLAIALADGQGASVQRVKLPGRGDVYVCHRAVLQSDGAVNHVVEVVSATALAGWVRLARTDGRLSYFAAEGDNPDFRVLHETDFSKAEVRSIHLAAQTGEAPNRVKLRWKEVRVRAEKLLSRTSKSGTNRTLVICSGVGFVVLFTVAMVQLKAKARRAGPNRVSE